MPAEEDEASLFDRKLKPLRLGPGVYARGMQTLITGAEILTSVSGGARCSLMARSSCATQPDPGHPSPILVIIIPPCSAMVIACPLTISSQSFETTATHAGQ